MPAARIETLRVCTFVHTLRGLDGFQWDPKKAKSNFKKHGVHFADVMPVFDDEMAITIEDDNEEERSVTIGTDALSRVVVVVWTWRDDDIRLISARPAEPRERKQYEAKR